MTRQLRHIAVAALCAVLFAAATALPLFDRLYDLDVDVLHAASHTVGGTAASDAAESSVAVVALDEVTYATKPFVGLPKVMWTPQIAAVQDALIAGGARVVGWDLILPTSAATYVADRNIDAPLLKSFARAREGGRIVLGTASFGNKTIKPHGLFAWSAGGAANMRSLNVNPDNDGVQRRIPTFHEIRKKDGTTAFQTSMASELAARVAGSAATRNEDGSVQLDGKTVRGSGTGAVLLNFESASGTIPTYSFADLHACATTGNTAFFEKHFADKAVLIGLVLDIEDRKLTSNRFYTDGGPIGPVLACTEGSAQEGKKSNRATTSGVYLQAVAVNNLLRGDGLVGFSLSSYPLLALPLTVLVALATILLPIGRAAVMSVLALLAWYALALILFGQSTLLPVLAPSVAVLATFISVLAVRFIYLDRQGRFLKRAFGSYVAPALVEQLVAQPERLKLGGERREMSYLFTDLAGFTGMVEKSDPEQAVRLLNDYLDRMIEIAKKHGGTIDKVIGDAVVVLFSAPVNQTNHAELAITCALDMDAFAEAFSAEQRARGIPFGITRIGVHSGTSIVGNFGGSGFFDYTALGDAMNTAARLESANKQFGTRIAVSGATVEQCPAFRGRKIGNVILKGKKEATPVFEPVSAETEATEAYARYGQAYEAMAANGRDARRAFTDLENDYPDDGLVALHARRLKNGESGETIELLEK